ncbi:MAG TPA: chalcone isomerase family protein [Thermoanaerobaculia bacterium]|jgi:hypothetical protein|nr:chalcone isomerase family protein [Thermoanaerobaculia bacterium]
MRKLTVACLALILTLSLLPTPAHAATVAGVTVPDKADAEGTALVLNGAGLRTKFIIKVYVGALYLQAKESNAAKILAADTARETLFHFLYGVSKEQMCDAWNEGLEQNTPNASAQVSKDFKTLCTWMEEIPKGNQMALVYVPGKGTTLTVNGKVKGTLAGKATSDAILATWIGADPAPGADFKKAVLGAK